MVTARYRIFLVEDNRTDQIAFQKMIQSEGISCDLTTARSVMEAKNILHSKSFDVIILDYMLENGTAFDVLEYTQETPVIVITGIGDEEIAIKAMKAGAYDYIVKDAERNYLKVLPITIEKTVKQREVDQALKDLSNLHKAITDNSFDSFVVVDEESKIIFANNAFITTSRYSIDELINTSLAEIAISEEFVTHLITSVKEGKLLKDLKTMLRPKSGPYIPVAVSVTPITGQNRFLFCFHDLRIDKDIREGIEHFQRFAAEHVRVSLFKWGLNGSLLPIVTEPLSFAKLEKDVLQKMGVFYLTTLTQGQGDSNNLGLFGPFPVPDTPDYIALTYSFKISDPDTDPRLEGLTYAFLVFSIPKTLEQFFTNRKFISQVIAENLEPIKKISNISLTDIQLIKHAILNVELN